MGGTEVLRRLPAFVRLERRIRRLFVTEDVRLFLPIDYPGLNLRPCPERAAAGAAGPLLHRAPSMGLAGGPGREAAARLRPCPHRAPFESALLERHGVHADFVGHPLLDATAGSPAATGGGHLRRGEGDRALSGIAGAGGAVHASRLRGSRAATRGAAPGSRFRHRAAPASAGVALCGSGVPDRGGARGDGAVMGRPHEVRHDHARTRARGGPDGGGLPHGQGGVGRRPPAWCAFPLSCSSTSWRRRRSFRSSSRIS